MWSLRHKNKPRPNTVFRNINQDQAPQQMYMPERKRIKEVYLRKQCVHHVCVINHFADSSNYKYDYRRYRIVAHLMPEGRVTVSFLVITLPFSSRVEQKSAQKGPTEGFYISKRLARENNYFTENVKTFSL